MECLNLMVSEPYYFSHFMAFFSYLVVRSSAIVAISPNVASRLFHWEIQAILAFSVLSLVKMVRKETWEALIADLLLYAKILFVALTLMIDYHLGLWYIALFAAIHIFTQQPLFQKLGTCSKLTPLQLEALLTEGNTSRYWLVEFRVSFSADCIRASSCFPELSITYSNKNLSFGIVDLGVFPNVAEKFGISIGGSGSSHLPTYILFEKASEIARFPDYDFEAKPPPSLTRKLLCQHFELDRLLLEYVNAWSFHNVSSNLGQNTLVVFSKFQRFPFGVTERGNHYITSYDTSLKRWGLPTTFTITFAFTFPQQLVALLVNGNRPRHKEPPPKILYRKKHLFDVKGRGGGGRGITGFHLAGSVRLAGFGPQRLFVCRLTEVPTRGMHWLNLKI